MLDSSTTVLAGAPLQDRASDLSPGIIGLLVQGIEIAMVFSQLATWLSLPGRTKHRFITILTIFITAVGFIQTAIVVISSWKIYILHPGEPIAQTWTEKIHLILTVLVATPVQLLLLWRCYNILNRNMYFIIPLLLLLLSSVALSIFDSIGLLWGVYFGPIPSGSNAFWCLLLYNALSSTLDVILSGILFHYLTQSRKRVYADHAVQWVSRHISIVWQSAIPPTLCAITLFIIYIVSRHLPPGELEMWFPTTQAVTGKLYVLSHFYNINSRPLLVGEQDEPPTAYVFPLTVPALHGTSTAALTVSEEHTTEPYTDSFGRTDEVTEGRFGSDSKTTSLPLDGVKLGNGRL